MNRFTFYMTLIVSLSFSQNIWGNGTVATSDNMDGLYYNPAALAINHGEIEGYFLHSSNRAHYVLPVVWAHRST